VEPIKIVLDFETFYDDRTGFKTQTTEEYIRDKRFQVIGVAVKYGDPAMPIWYSGTHEEIKTAFMGYDWKNAILVCHNTQFDGAILKWIFGIKPVFYMDTLSMARALHGVEVGGSLKALAIRYNIGEKGTEVEKAKGKRREDFTYAELQEYARYCVNDVELTYKLSKLLGESFPADEYELIDMTLRMFINPVLEVDDAMLVTRLDELKVERLRLLGSLMEGMGCPDEESVRKKLASNKQFAEVLKENGVEVPMKLSKTTGKETFALAKNDEGFIALTESDNLFVQQLCAVRLGTKSTMEETRVARFIDVGKRNKGKLPVPLKYYGAHTGRWAGADKINFQNLPSRDERKKALKNSVMAPIGHTIINSDSSQIEARVLAWLAGQEDVVQSFRDKRDIYCEFATKIYKRPITKADKVERFVGKTCVLGLGYGTGWKKLQHTLKTTPPGAVLSDEECQRIVNLYRSDNDKIVALWKECDLVLKHLAKWPDKNAVAYSLGVPETVIVRPEGIQLPNSLYIRYPDLQWKNEGYVFNTRKGEASLWGGGVVENVVQALARIVVGEQMIRISRRYPVALTVHDAAVCIAPNAELEEAKKFMVEVMSTPPVWGSTIPIACEAKSAVRYGEC